MIAPAVVVALARAQPPSPPPAGHGPPPAVPASQGQAPAKPNPSAPASPTPVKPGVDPQTAAPPQESYSYRTEGRRDPFQSLLTAGGGLASRKGEGPTGMTLAEISVRGVLQSRGSLVAMIQGPDNRTYIVHQGDKLLDGTIKTITPQGLVVVQEVNDPLSLVKQREVRKLLRSLEDAK
jgi:Tfp pilus assembly protein PilP